MNKIPDQSGEVDLRLRIQPWLHDEVMAYGLENGVRSTTERYCLALTHLFRLLNRPPKVYGSNAAICGMDAETERAIQECMSERRCEREAAIAYLLNLGSVAAKGTCYQDWPQEETEAERRRA